jgi:predicted DNA-binding transcriptional regulator YafY
MSRGMGRTARLQRLEELLLSSSSGYSVGEIARKLNVHRTTVWRDINQLSLDAPVQQEGALYFIRADEYLPNLRLSCGESLMLSLMLQRMLRKPTRLPPPLLRHLESSPLLFVIRPSCR